MQQKLMGIISVNIDVIHHQAITYFRKNKNLMGQLFIAMQGGMCIMREKLY
jgi:hypothetical protein